MYGIGVTTAPFPSYSVCIRREAGMCCNQYVPCADAMSFTLDSVGAIAEVDGMCAMDYIGIPGETLKESLQDNS